MRHDQTDYSGQEDSQHFLTLTGWLGIAGCIALLVGTMVAPFFVPDYNWMTDTISDLAAGQSELIMDIALYGFAVGLLTTALAAAHAHSGRKTWSVGVLSLVILAGIVVVVGARNEYGDQDNEGIVIHTQLVYGLGVFFTLAPLCMAGSLAENHNWAKWSLIVLAILWCVAAPIFFFLPTSIDGLYERGLGLIACAIVVTLDIVFLSRARTDR